MRTAVCGVRETSCVTSGPVESHADIRYDRVVVWRVTVVRERPVIHINIASSMEHIIHNTYLYAGKPTGTAILSLSTVWMRREGHCKVSSRSRRPSASAFGALAQDQGPVIGPRGIAVQFGWLVKAIRQRNHPSHFRV
jgi:hypothetical protein